MYLTDNSGVMSQTRVLSGISLIWEERELWIDGSNPDILYRESATRAGGPLRYHRKVAAPHNRDDPVPYNWGNVGRT
ncbi:unnamed protein product [Amoebophrya sp. A120]|nr:unnamed protein product [Amoebophrya sp. A120]|eukprot:GSA120T00005909001.1